MACIKTLSKTQFVCKFVTKLARGNEPGLGVDIRRFSHKAAKPASVSAVTKARLFLDVLERHL